MRKFCRRAVVIRSLMLLALAAFASADAAMAQETTCHIKGVGAGASGPAVSVATDAASPRTVRSGDAVKVRWEVKSKLDPDCRTPLYLMFSMHERVRFTGEGFFVLPPNVDAPFGIPQDKNRMRVFVPLHVGDSVAKGSFDVMVYTAAHFELSWQLLEVPKLAAKPTAKKDYARGKAVAAPGASGKTTIVIAQGRPAIVFQDRYTSETPKKVIVHGGAGYEIQEFDTFFRVIERDTGEMIMERVGVAPRFSPTGRFVLSFGVPSSLDTANQTEMIVADLRTGAVALDHRRSGSEETSGSRYVEVRSVRWGLGDAYLSISHGSGGITLNSMLVRRASKTNAEGCNACSAIDATDHHVDLESAVSLYHFRNDGLEWLADSLLFSDLAWFRATSPAEQKEFETIAPELKRLKISNAEAQARHDAAHAKTVAGTPAASDAFPTRPETAEDRREKQLAERSSELEESILKKAKLQVAGTHLLAPRGQAPVVDLRPLEKWDEGGKVVAAVAADREVAAKPSDAAVPGTRQRSALSTPDTAPPSGDRLAPRLAEWGLTANRRQDGKARDYQPTLQQFTDSETRWFIDPLTQSNPAAKSVFFLGEPGGYRGCDMSGTDYLGLPEQVISAGSVYTAKTWQVGGAPVWLIANSCRVSTGDDRHGQLILLRGSDTGGPKLNWLSLEKFAGEDVGPLLGIYDGRTIVAEILHGRYLAIAAEGKPRIAVFDLTTDRLLHVFESAAQNDVIQRILLTDDARHLIQVNADGGLQVYSMAAKARIAGGRFIDDEILFFDDRGYYGGTPESAHYVYLKFPGVPGKHSFHQFRATLNKPDLIRTLLADGKVDAPVPQLPVPPIVAFTAAVTDKTAGVRALKLALRASAEAGLKAVRVFVDGQLERMEPLTGIAQARDILLDIPSATRWITVEAEDTKGFESVPVTLALKPSATAMPAGHLHVLAAGTDAYDDWPNLDSLEYAKSDAVLFLKVAKASEGRAYKSVSTEAMLDAPDLRTRLIDRLGALAKGATDKDTIMLFVAGHGKQDVKAGKFYLLTTATLLDDLAGTAIAADAIAKAVEGTKARVILFLDACNSGAANGLGTNEDAAAAFLDRKIAITVIAASKGRQTAKEGGGNPGGVFTRAMHAAIVDNRAGTDANRNGTIELTEFYGAVKRRVSELTKGTQTPWIARNNMVGEIPLF